MKDDSEQREVEGVMGKGARLLLWLALGMALGFYGITVAQAQSLPAGCTPVITSYVVACGGTTPPSCPVVPPVCPIQALPGCAPCTTPPPVCAPTPPVCPTQPPAGCAPCTPPVEPPSASCGDLKVTTVDITFTPQTTLDFRLGRGDKEVWIGKYTVQSADAGKRSHLNMVEHGSGLHHKTAWASKTKCEMNGDTQQAVSSSPSIYVSVNGTDPVNMAVGETWYFMFRNLSKTGSNTCVEDGGCGERFTAYQWQSSATVFQRGGPIPPRDQPKKSGKK